jgi:hypothetical protein
MLHVLDRELDGEGFRDWTSFEHPQLGPVEIGGWHRTFTWTNPPGPMLEEVTSTNAKFVLRAARTAPKLEIRETKVEPLVDGLYKVTVVIQNTGFLPTYVTETAHKAGVSKPIKVEIALAESGAIVTGKPECELGHLDGRANTFGQLSFNDVYPILNSAKAEWIVRQPAGTSVTVTASTAKAGTARAEITLG